MSFRDRVNSAEDLGPVPWWEPSEKAPAIIGELIEYRRDIPTQYGDLDGAVIRLDERAAVREARKEQPRWGEPGEYAAVWLKETVLRREWRKPAPGGGEALVGETVGVKLTGVREGASGPYRTFKVFVDRDPAAVAMSSPAPTPRSGGSERLDGGSERLDGGSERLDGGSPARMDQATALEATPAYDDDLPF
ncbi:hypothetical protein [Candidatus Palauibacter sp.]|uniref:hypothetical protein n=1 Tax=Candidatus Palauibacter sp. TaxID=3101350 RepID=UPI003CC5E9EB